MGQTSESAKRVRDALLAKDPDYYKKLGTAGGKHTGLKGLALVNQRKRKSIARKGGKNAWKTTRQERKQYDHSKKARLRGTEETSGESQRGAQQAPSPTK